MNVKSKTANPTKIAKYIIPVIQLIKSEGVKTVPTNFEKLIIEGATASFEKISKALIASGIVNPCIRGIAYDMKGITQIVARTFTEVFMSLKIQYDTNSVIRQIPEYSTLQAKAQPLNIADI